MSTTTSATPMTAEQLLRHRDDGFRYELVRGELRQKPLRGFQESLAGMNLAAPLARHVEANKLGLVFMAGTGFILERDPDTVRAPSTAFVSAQRLPKNVPLSEGYFEGAPDLVVEVVSPGDTHYEVEEQVQAWLTAGTGAVWIVNPKRRAVSVHTAMGSVTLTAPQILDGGSIVPGFTLPVAEVFA